jgi:hypothetical protein
MGTDRQTDEQMEGRSGMTKLINAFHNSAYEPKNNLGNNNKNKFVFGLYIISTDFQTSVSKHINKDDLLKQQFLLANIHVQT